MLKEPVIESSDLAIGYYVKNKKKFIVHEKLQFRLFAGELTGLLGLNGSGKSTLLRTICGFQPAMEGKIYVKERLLEDYSQSELSRMIGVVLTEKTNVGRMNVYEMASLGRYPYTGFFGALTKKDKRIVWEALEAVGMTDKADRYVSELSDGERQKTMIAKVLAQQCSVVILDEPTAYLDVTSRIETMSLLHRLAKEQQIAILLSTHDLELAIQMCDCLWLLETKRSLFSGTPEYLILSGDFEKIFNKKGFAFDTEKGKIMVDEQVFPISVEGDTKTSHWVINALIRNGLRPSLINNSTVKVVCFDPNKLSLFTSENGEQKANNIEELVGLIKKIKF